MTSPWPEPDYDNHTIICVLCLKSKKFSELSRDPDYKLTDVCMKCRSLEIQGVLKS